MEFTVAKIAEMLSAEVVGNKDAVIKTVCKIEEGFEGGLSFLANPKYTNYIYDTKATAVLVSDTFVPEKEITTTLIKVKDAYIAFATLLDFYSKMNPVKKGISKHAVIAESAKIGQNVYIAEFVSVGENAVVADNAQLFPHVCVGDNAKVGEDSVLNSGVKLYQGCVIGKSCIIHAGTVIGADGFGFASKDDESYMKVPQLGNVVVEDGVEIGANTCIDRATMGSTIIRKNVKLDNLIQIAHNVEIGENTVFAAQVGIAGSTKIGKNCMFGGQVGVNGHITIGDKVMIGAQSAVANSLEGGQILLGSPVSPIREEKLLILYRKKLPELYKRVEQIEKKLKEI